MVKKIRGARPGTQSAVRQRILDAARDLFVREGYEAVSMRRVAKKIRYSPTTIYLYFRDKAELFSCLCDELYDQLTELPSMAAAFADDPLSFLRRVLRAYVEFGLANPNQYRVAFLLTSRMPLESKDFLPTDSKPLQAYDLFRQAVRRCVRAKVFRKVDVDAACQSLWAAVHGLTSLLILFPTFPWVRRDQLIAFGIDSMLRGMMAPKALAKGGIEP
ncbi:MAG: TetR/AcrR family transcriptional regulator [Planctomycetota bacterium]